MNPAAGNRFYSKVSYGLLLFIALGFGLPLLLLLYKEIWLGALFLLGLSYLPISMYQRTYYQITDDTLLIVSGFTYKQSIAISAIKSIEDSPNLMSSPALSFDRQEIRYNNLEFVLISLKDEDKPVFYDLIRQINPDIKLKVNTPVVKKIN